MEVQSYMRKFSKNFFEVHLLNGGGIVSTDTLNSEAIIINIEDYNSKSMGIL